MERLQDQIIRIAVDTCRNKGFCDALDVYVGITGHKLCAVNRNERSISLQLISQSLRGSGLFVSERRSAHAVYRLKEGNNGK